MAEKEKEKLLLTEINYEEIVKNDYILSPRCYIKKYSKDKN